MPVCIPLKRAYLSAAVVDLSPRRVKWQEGRKTDALPHARPSCVHALNHRRRYQGYKPKPRGGATYLLWICATHTGQGCIVSISHIYAQLDEKHFPPYLKKYKKLTAK